MHHPKPPGENTPGQFFNVLLACPFGRADLKAQAALSIRIALGGMAQAATPHIQTLPMLRDDTRIGQQQCKHAWHAAPAQTGCWAQHLSLPHAGGSAPGQWQVTWQYLACLLKNGELYEQLGAWEDASVALKEGLQLVRHTPKSSSSLHVPPFGSTAGKGGLVASLPYWIQCQAARSRLCTPPRAVR